MSVATNYAGVFRNVTLGQAGSFIGFMTLAASLFLVAFELKQARDIAEIELSTQRLDIYHKVNSIYDPDSRIRKDEVLRKLVKEGIETLSPSEIAVAWIAVEGNLNLASLAYQTYTKGLRQEFVEYELDGYASLICHFPILFEELLGMDEFDTLLKKRAATIDCTQLPLPFLEDRLKAR